MNWIKGRSVNLPVDRQKTLDNRCAYVNVSQDDGNDSAERKDEPLVFGEETLFVNAAIMDVEYEPVNAPWLVDLDLPIAEQVDS